MALVGASGEGKTTILNLIPRFYDAISGDISIDKQSIYKSKIKSLRKNISLVSQDTTLFDDTVRNNIIYANSKANDDDIEMAAKLSFAADFINKLPNLISPTRPIFLNNSKELFSTIQPELVMRPTALRF